MVSDLPKPETGPVENKAIDVDSLVALDADGKPKTTSLIVADVFGKRHDNLIRDIQSLECSEEFHSLNFEEMLYERELGQGAKRLFPMYSMTRDGFSFLVMGFTGKKAAEWKEKFIAAFNRMETALMERATVPATVEISEEMVERACSKIGKNLIEQVKDYTSLIVADAFGKEHKDVLRAVENLETSEEFARRNFAPRSRIVNGREFPTSKSPATASASQESWYAHG